MRDFSAAEIRVFLAGNLPCYDAEGSDDFIYLVRAEDIERVAIELYRYLKGAEADAKIRDTLHVPVAGCEYEVNRGMLLRKNGLQHISQMYPTSSGARTSPRGIDREKRDRDEQGYLVNKRRAPG